MYSLFTLLLMLVFLVNTALAAAPATAVAPDVMTIMKKTKEAFEPMRPSKRKMIITSKSNNGDTVQWIAGQALKKFPDGQRMLLVMLEPADIKCLAYLVWEQENKPDLMFIYIPYLRRVKKMTGFVDRYTSFLYTDFTYADLGFIKLNNNYQLIGEENHGGVQAYKIEVKNPGDKYDREPFYSRVITWVAADTFLPLQRDYYDLNVNRWKTELFEDVSAINGVPTSFRITMKNVKENNSTELYLSDVEYDVKVPDEIFDPSALPQVANHQCWRAYCPVTVPKK